MRLSKKRKKRGVSLLNARNSLYDRILSYRVPNTSRRNSRTIGTKDSFTEGDLVARTVTSERHAMKSPVAIRSKVLRRCETREREGTQGEMTARLVEQGKGSPAE